MVGDIVGEADQVATTCGVKNVESVQKRHMMFQFTTAGSKILYLSHMWEILLL